MCASAAAALLVSGAHVTDAIAQTPDCEFEQHLGVTFEGGEGALNDSPGGGGLQPPRISGSRYFSQGELDCANTTETRFILERGGRAVAEFVQPSGPAPPSYGRFEGFGPQVGDVVRVTVGGREEFVATYNGLPTVDSGACRGSVRIEGRRDLSSSWVSGTIPAGATSFSGDRYVLVPRQPLELINRAGNPEVVFVRQRGGPVARRVAYLTTVAVKRACPGQAPVPRTPRCRPNRRGSCVLTLGCPEGTSPCRITVRPRGSAKKLVRTGVATVAPRGRRAVRLRLTARGLRRDRAALPLTIELRRDGDLHQVHDITMRVR